MYQIGPSDSEIREMIFQIFKLQIRTIYLHPQYSDWIILCKYNIFPIEISQS